MPRANRQFYSSSVWHITHRCHNRDFLLKFACDRRLWRYWLYEARRRYKLGVLNFTVTSNHVHVMVSADDRRTIPRALQLVAGRTAQSYNRRKKRRGAFWEDRYHAVPITTQHHFCECLVYIDLNMVRAGVVSHPRDWQDGGYNELQRPRQRYVVIDYPKLLQLADAGSEREFQLAHLEWVENKLASGKMSREGKWTDDVAGSLYAERGPTRSSPLDWISCAKNEV